VSPAGFEAIARVMRQLREEGGCPWDREQTVASLRPYLVEESYEVLDAIDRLGAAKDASIGSSPRADPKAIDGWREELGDLLLQIMFQSRIAEEFGWFKADDVAQGIADKMVRRHPHVFAGVEGVDTPDAVVDRWEKQKAREGRGALSGVPDALPALLRAQRVGEKAARVGFDWHAAADVLDKVDEETRELREAMATRDKRAMHHELGDLLFALCSLGRHLGVDAEQSLRDTLDRFTRRFNHVEASLEADGIAPGGADLADLERRWQLAKRATGE